VVDGAVRRAELGDRREEATLGGGGGEEALSTVDLRRKELLRIKNYEMRGSRRDGGPK
jgi:hypothetical protein